MNFYETRMGRNFFEWQLPKLIAALQDISKKLSPSPAAIRLPVEGDPDFLTELYKKSEIWEPSAENRRLSQRAIQVQQRFLPGMTERERQDFEQYEDIVENRSLEFAERAYRAGFQTAVQMMVAGLSIQPEGEEEGCGEDD